MKLLMNYWKQYLKNKEITDWSETVKKNKSYNINEMIANIDEVIYRAFNYYLTPSQIISILLLVNKQENLGRITQILTGEGKTAIIIAVASINI